MDFLSNEVLDFDLEVRNRILGKVSPPNSTPGEHLPYPGYILVKEPVLINYNISIIDLLYQPFSPVLSPITIGSSNFINDTAATNKTIYTNKKSTTSVYTVTISRTIKFSVGVSLRIGTPIIGGGVDASVEISTINTETKTTSEARDWQWSVEIVVPPRSRIEATVMLQEAVYSPSFNARFKLVGFAVAKSLIGNRDVKVGIGKLFRHLPHDSIIPSWGNDETLEIEFSGNFSGVQGIRQTIETKQFNLETQDTERGKIIF